MANWRLLPRPKLVKIARCPTRVPSYKKKKEKEKKRTQKATLGLFSLVARKYAQFSAIADMSSNIMVAFACVFEWVEKRCASQFA
jgi:hypothetical protein